MPSIDRATDAEFIGVDVGATKTYAVRANADGRVSRDERRPTHAESPDTLLDGIVGMVRALLTPAVAGVGVGLPGMVRAESGLLLYAPTFPFGLLTVGEHLHEMLGLPVVCDNDANAAAWAEHLLGAASGRHSRRHSALVTVGTGLGCGMVVDGRLLRGAHGFAAEVSHLIVEPGGEPCACGERGCWGIEATGYAITRRARASGRDHAAWRTAAADRDATSTDRDATSTDRDITSTDGTALRGETAITGELVTAAALRGDRIAVEILRHTGELLGRGLAALANLLDPDVLVVGGGASAAGDLLLAPARQSFRGRLYAADRRPEIPVVAARLGDAAGAVGAALLAATGQRRGD